MVFSVSSPFRMSSGTLESLLLYHVSILLFVWLKFSDVGVVAASYCAERSCCQRLDPPLCKIPIYCCASQVGSAFVCFSIFP
jgi:hypothetical protein